MSRGGSDPLLGSSRAIEDIRATIASVADYDDPVLILGESGTGKEVVAEALHRASRRGNLAMHTVNCAALAGDMLAAELYGHRRGSFTGAADSRLGRLRAARGSTLLLDEISEAPRAFQALILRTAERGEVQPVGHDSTEVVDVRLLAASNRPLVEIRAGGVFRRDLLYRLTSFVIVIPPLRERPEDIRPIGAKFLQQLGTTLGRDLEVAEAGWCRLEAHSFPGNARGLRQILVRASALSGSGQLQKSHIDAAIRAGAVAEPAPETAAPGDGLGDVIRTHIANVLGACDGNLSAAARRLDIPRSTLQHYLVKYGVERDQSSSCSA